MGARYKNNIYNIIQIFLTFFNGLLISLYLSRYSIMLIKCLEVFKFLIVVNKVFDSI